MTQSKAAANTDAFLSEMSSSLLRGGYLTRPVFGLLTGSGTEKTEVILSLEENRHIKLPADPIKVS